MKKNLLLVIATVLLTYGVAEALSTYLYVKGWLEPFSIWFLEKHGPGVSHVSFDPQIGYRLSGKPTRMGAYTTIGGIQTWGISQGNNFGFPDSRDFTIKKRDAKKIRLAIFGDSFSASQYLPTPWPDRAEEFLEGRGIPVEIMNFSIDGGGLGNWWSTITQVIKAQQMEVDALVFVVFSTDLMRSFMLWDDEAHLKLNWDRAEMGAQYMNHWETNRFPKSREDLILGPLDRFHLMSPKQVDELLEGRRSLPTDRKWQPYLWRLFWSQFISEAAANSDDGSSLLMGGFSNPRKLQLITDIREFAESRGIRLIVVNNADNFLDGVGFANLLEAEMVDASGVF
ncbi:MAG: hypothetical protein KDD43_16865, partial [Bdellovibrionales bacterium]|nr:hypothetical protein [Bdellovibrionales bacterium]